MDTKGSNTFRWVSVIVIGLVVALCVWLAIPRLDTAALSAILGALVGAAVPGLVALWSKNRELEEHLKDRVSSQALDLARFDFAVRRLPPEKQLWLPRPDGTKWFYAPPKVYREYYKALLSLHKTGTWPPTIQEMGLLSILESTRTEPQEDNEQL
jgi:hypothetical protein